MMPEPLNPYEKSSDPKDLYLEAFHKLKDLASEMLKRIQPGPDEQEKALQNKSLFSKAVGDKIAYQNYKNLREGYESSQRSAQWTLTQIIAKINVLKEKDTDNKLLPVLTEALNKTHEFLDGKIDAETYQTYVKKIDEQKLTNSALSTGLQVLEGLMLGLAAIAMIGLFVLPLLVITGTVALPLMPIVVTMAVGLIGSLVGGFVAAFKAEKIERTSVVSEMQNVSSTSQSTANYKEHLAKMKEAPKVEDIVADNPESHVNKVPT